MVGVRGDARSIKKVKVTDVALTLCLYFLSSPDEDFIEEAEPAESRYVDIIIYTSGFLAVAMAVVIVILCRMQTTHSKQTLQPPPVHKLARFPLIRQVSIGL